MFKKTERIRALNDAFRTTLSGGQIFITAGVQELGEESVTQALQTLIRFNDFTKDNDPYQEHDFGSFALDGHTLFWKIDYYANDMETGSPDPTDPTVTTRVLTLMLAEEY